MNFASDNTGPVHPKVMEALQSANDGFSMPYGNDDLTAQVVQQIRQVFEAPEAAVYLVATGTAANALILATLCQPWESVFCSHVSHIQEDECGAPDFFMGGGRLITLPHRAGKISPRDLETAIAGEGSRGVHGVQPGALSLTQATEKGTVYSLVELQALTTVAKAHGLRTHLDGARFANALVALGCSPAEMTWKAGIDAVSFGGTKNGLMGVEAVVFFDPQNAWEFELRRKRGAHLFSKHRYLAAQMLAYLDDELWLDMARTANARCATLASGLREVQGARLLYPAEANIIFAEWHKDGHDRLQTAGAAYYPWPSGGSDPNLLQARLVCDWSGSDGDIRQFLSVLRGEG